MSASFVIVSIVVEPVLNEINSSQMTCFSLT